MIRLMYLTVQVDGGIKLFKSLFSAIFIVFNCTQCDEISPWESSCLFSMLEKKKTFEKKLEKREVGEIKIFYNSRFFVNSAGFTLPLIYEREKLALILLHFNNCCMFLLFTTIQQSSLSHPPRQPTPSTKIQYYSFFFLRSHRQHTILAGREQHRH